MWLRGRPPFPNVLYSVLNRLHPLATHANADLTLLCVRITIVLYGKIGNIIYILNLDNQSAVTVDMAAIDQVSKSRLMDVGRKVKW